MESMIDSPSDFRVLDRQLAFWANRLVNELGIEAGAASELGSTIAREVAVLDQQVKLRLRESQPVRLADRLGELVAFQGFMDSVHTRQPLHRPWFVLKSSFRTTFASCTLGNLVSASSGSFRSARRNGAVLFSPTIRSALFAMPSPTRIGVTRRTSLGWSSGREKEHRWRNPLSDGKSPKKISISGRPSHVVRHTRLTLRCRHAAQHAMEPTAPANCARRGSSLTLARRTIKTDDVELTCRGDPQGYEQIMPPVALFPKDSTYKQQTAVRRQR